MRFSSIAFLAGVSVITGGGGGDLNFVKASTARQGDFGSDTSLTFGSNASIGSHILAVFTTDQIAQSFSGTGATSDATEFQDTLFRAQGLRTPSIASAASVFPYSISSGSNFGGVAIEVTGNSPVFDSVFSQTEAVGSTSMRTLNITVAEDNSIVLFIGSGDNDRTLTYSSNMNSLSSGITYHPVAWGKFDAGTHTIEYTPSGGVRFYGAAAFIWSPGA